METSDDDIEEIQKKLPFWPAVMMHISLATTDVLSRVTNSGLLWSISAADPPLDLLKPGPFDEMSIAIICRELLLGLDYLHENGKIHRDVKAANVLLSDTGDVKIGDFGVATQLTNNLSKRNTFVGTPFGWPRGNSPGRL